MGNLRYLFSLFELCKNHNNGNNYYRDEYFLVLLMKCLGNVVLEANRTRVDINIGRVRVEKIYRRFLQYETFLFSPELFHSIRRLLARLFLCVLIDVK